MVCLQVLSRMESKHLWVMSEYRFPFRLLMKREPVVTTDIT